MPPGLLVRFVHFPPTFSSTGFCPPCEPGLSFSCSGWSPVTSAADSVSFDNVLVPRSYPHLRFPALSLPPRPRPCSAAVKETVDILVEGGKKSVGSLIKEKHRGKFHDEWSKAYVPHFPSLSLPRVQRVSEAEITPV